MNDAQCAHSRVILKHIDHPNGTRSDYWECDYGCGKRFAPVNVVTDGPSQPAVPNIEALEQASRLLRTFARERQEGSGRWTAQEQAIVECAIKLESLCAPSLQPTSSTQPTEGGWNPASRLPRHEGAYACYTNYLDLFVLKFTAGKWEKPDRFNVGEAVAFWQELPQ